MTAFCLLELSSFLGVESSRCRREGTGNNAVAGREIHLRQDTGTCYSLRNVLFRLIKMKKVAHCSQYFPLHGILADWSTVETQTTVSIIKLFFFRCCCCFAGITGNLYRALTVCQAPRQTLDVYYFISSSQTPPVLDTF